LQYKNLEESAHLLPQPLEGIVELINETVKLLFQQHNYGKTDTEHFMIHSRSSVEKYIFSRLYNRIIAMYKIKNKELDNEYKEKKEVVKTWSIDKLFKELKIPEDYLNGVKEVNTPYRSAIQLLNYLEDDDAPREKVRNVMKAHQELKVCVMEYTKGKIEISSTENLSKLLAYVIACSHLTSPAAELNFLKDYLLYQEGNFAAEEYLLTNLQVFLLVNKIGKSNLLCSNN